METLGVYYTKVHIIYKYLHYCANYIYYGLLTLYIVCQYANNRQRQNLESGNDQKMKNNNEKINV